MPFSRSTNKGESEEEAHYRERRLHDEAPLIRTFPFDEQRAIVELKPAKMHGTIDLKG
jgi:hypothetical protein